jgi:hypothetical protein
MTGYPIIDCAKVVRDRTSVQYVAGSMAEMGSAVHKVHLSLQQAYSIIQLCGHWESLVGCCIAGFDEGRVVG